MARDSTKHQIEQHFPTTVRLRLRTLVLLRLWWLMPFTNAKRTRLATRTVLLFTRDAMLISDDMLVYLHFYTSSSSLISARAFKALLHSVCRKHHDFRSAMDHYHWYAVRGFCSFLWILIATNSWFAARASTCFWRHNLVASTRHCW